MRILFISHTMPGVFGPLAEYFAAQSGNDVVFAAEYSRRSLELPGVLELFSDEERAGRLITPRTGRTTVLLGEDLQRPMPGLCFMSKRYLAGGGLTGAMALLGPTRMPFEQLMPVLDYFALKLGECMAGKTQEDTQ